VSTQVKWIVSSRDWQEIKELLTLESRQVRLSLELNAESVSAAVKTYIDYKVTDLAKQKNHILEMQNQIKSYLHVKAADTFLWVALVYQQLKNNILR
jgi:hypothetical protein